MRDQKGVDLHGMEGGKEIEGGESVIRVYYMRKMSSFSKRKNNVICYIGNMKTYTVYVLYSINILRV